VNDQPAGAESAIPSRARAPVETWTEYVVEYASAAVGVNVKRFVLSSYETLAATGAPFASASVTVDDVIVVGSIEREKLPTTVAVRDTPVADAAGDTAVTVGGAGSGDGTASRSTK
jgi:hypothetical protein